MIYKKLLGFDDDEDPEWEEVDNRIHSEYGVKAKYYKCKDPIVRISGNVFDVSKRKL